MIPYKFTRQGDSFFMDFLSFAEAETFSLLLEPMMVEELPTKPSLGIVEKNKSNKAFCLYLTDRFTKQNKEANITEIESLELMEQFNNILSFAQVGSVDSVYSLLQQVATSRVYTQERKDKDLSDIQNYINNTL